MSSFSEKAAHYLERSGRIIRNNKRPLVGALALASTFLIVTCGNNGDIPANPTDNPKIKIIAPARDQNVNRMLEVSGKLSRGINSEESVVVLVRNLADPIHYHPQSGIDAQGRNRKVQVDGQTWTGLAEITDPNVHRVEITASWTNEYGTSIVDQYVRDNSKVGRWQGLYGGIQRGSIAETTVVVNVP